MNKDSENSLCRVAHGAVASYCTATEYLEEDDEVSAQAHARLALRLIRTAYERAVVNRVNLEIIQKELESCGRTFDFKSLMQRREAFMKPEEDMSERAQDLHTRLTKFDIFYLMLMRF